MTSLSEGIIYYILTSCIACLEMRGGGMYSWSGVVSWDSSKRLLLSYFSLHWDIKFSWQRKKCQCLWWSVGVEQGKVYYLCTKTFSLQPATLFLFAIKRFFSTQDFPVFIFFFVACAPISKSFNWVECAQLIQLCTRSGFNLISRGKRLVWHVHPYIHFVFHFLKVLHSENLILMFGVMIWDTFFFFWRKKK